MEEGQWQFQQIEDDGCGEIAEVERERDAGKKSETRAPRVQGQPGDMVEDDQSSVEGMSTPTPLPPPNPPLSSQQASPNSPISSEAWCLRRPPVGKARHQKLHRLKCLFFTPTSCDRV
ncbi:unnamed protein product [Pleuronectes platessa]|uniref:Uncharacterized protein n=1 Tax=Pleuronectes platessa TaxID=8262 RepID=A0A9N7Z9B5_PLEPL|nr:unnamed protein product [Pleuronectes platessa]